MKMSLAISAACAAAFAGPTLANPAFASPAQDIIKQEKCSKCHTAKTTKKGPAWSELAEKYKGKPEAVAALVQMLKTGGKEDHNIVKASDEELKAIVEIVLSAK